MPMYSKNFADLIAGSYGKTPWPVDPEFRYKICGTREEIPFDISKYKPQENSPVPEAGGMLLAINEKELLLLELFPSVARKFLRDKRIAEWKAAHPEAALNADQEPKRAAPSGGKPCASTI